MRRRVRPEALKALRQEKAWTQDHLAMAAGLTARTVQRAERSGHCSAETVLALAGALDVDVSLLMVLPVTQVEAGSEGDRLVSRSGQVI